MSCLAIKWPLIAVGLLLAALVLGAGMAGWVHHAGALLLSMGEAGLSWCL